MKFTCFILLETAETKNKNTFQIVEGCSTVVEKCAL
jgi:hypothetical protein